MKLVIIESPFAGKSHWRLVRWWQQRQNVKYARACVRDSLNRGEAPIASHILYTQKGILNDNIPVERQQGIDAGLAWRRVNDFTACYTDRGITKGMRYGITAAESARKIVVYRSLKKR